MIKLIVYGKQIEKYLTYYEYNHKFSDAEDDNDYAYGFFKPKNEFEEMFKYIVSYGDGDTYSGENDFSLYLTCNQKYTYRMGDIRTIMSNSDIFTFEFPDEETALYFQLKFNN